jgi:hypothetical protein
MFCSNCGAPLSGAFCGNCGRPAPQAAQPVAKPAAPAGSTPPVQSGGALKVVLICFLCLGVLGLMSAAGLYYAATRVKSRLLSAAGVARATEHGRSSAGSKIDACALLSKEELGELLGIHVDRAQPIADGGEPGCAFFASPETLRQLARDSLSKAPEQVKTAEAKGRVKGDNPLANVNTSTIQGLEGIVKTIAAAGDASQGGGKVFSFTVDPKFDAESWPLFLKTMSVVPGFEPLAGVGDHALMGPFGQILYVQKGNVKVTLELTSVPDAHGKGVDLARKIISRL